MKTLFKVCLVLSFCFAVLCARNLGFQVDSIAVATQNNFGAPYLYLSIGGSLYLVNLQSIYEIYVDPNTNQWMKDFTTETTFDKLSWKINSNLAQGNVALLGTPCPCQNANQSQNLEPFQTRRVGRQVRDDPFEEVTCTPANFDYLRFVFQYVPGMNNTACTPIDLGMCTTECTQACSNVTNAASCTAGCSAITSASIADTNLCYTACNNSGTLDNDCVNGCLNMIGCISEYSCRLDFGYHLHKYMWSNVTGGNSNASRKLAFAFEIVPQANVENVTCGAEVAHWINGPFVLWINTTCLAGIHQDGCVECLPDLTNATEVPAVANFGPGPNSVVGRFYVDPFTGGYSIFNQPVEIINPISTTSR